MNINGLIFRRHFRVTSLILSCCFSSLVLHAQTKGVSIANQSIGFKITAREGRVQIPFTTVHNLIIIPVSVNGSVPLNFILDCGISHTIVSEPEFASLFGLKPERDIQIFGAGGSHEVKAAICPGNTIEMQGVRGDGIPIILLQEDYLSLSAMLGIPIFGLLGSELFRELAIGIDYIEKKLVFENPSRFHTPRGYLRVPVRIQAGKPHLFIQLEQAGGYTLDIEVMADLGASHFLLLETPSDARLVIPEAHLEANVGYGLAGPIKGSYARANSIRIGKHRIPKPIVAYTAHYAPSDQPAKRNGTIGGEFLSRFNLWFDLSHNAIYFQRNRHYNRPFSQDKSGMGVMAGGYRLEDVIVVEVRQPSPAWEAGIRPGDQVMRLNGARVKGLDRINTIMRQRSGKKIKLVIEREGQTFETLFRLGTGI